MRTYWTAPAIFHADVVNGNDANDGLTAPFKTLMAGYRAIRQNHDFGGYNPCLYLANGRYNTPLITEGPLVGAEFLSVIGDTTTPGNVLIQTDWNQPCFGVRDHAILILQGMRLITYGGCSTGIDCSQFGVVDFDHLEFGYFPFGSHISVNTIGSVNCTGGYAIVGNAACHVKIGAGSQFTHGNASVTVNSGIEFRDANANITPLLSVTDNSIYNGGATFTGPGAGTATGGKQYSVSRAIANMNGTVWPGNVPGTGI